MKKYLFSEIIQQTKPYVQFKFEIQNKEHYNNYKNYELFSSLFDLKYIRPGKYQFKKSFIPNRHEFKLGEILDRERNFLDLDNLLKERQIQWNHDKSQNNLISIGAVAGAGKTTFGQYYGLTRCQKGFVFFDNFGSIQDTDDCQTIPLYATFNNNTTYSEKENNVNMMLSSRFLFDFLNSIHLQGEIDSYKEKLFDNFIGSIKIFNDYSVSQVIDLILSLSQRNSIFLFVDEIKRIEDQELQKKLITLLGTSLDNNQNLHLLLSTLDVILIDQTMAGSQRKVNYIFMKPLLSIKEYMINKFQFKQLQIKGRAALIAMIEISSIPRAVDSAFLMLQENDNTLLSKDYQYISELFSRIKSINDIFNAINRSPNIKSLFLAALNSVLQQNKNINFQNMEEIIEKQNKGTVGMCLKYGIFLSLKYDFPRMNLLIINKILKQMKIDLEILDWMPASYFLNISDISFDFEKIPLLKFTRLFEIFIAKIDIFYRVFNFYDNNLIPKEEKLINDQKMLIKYSELFCLKQNDNNQVFQVFGDANNYFQLQKKYSLNDNFAEISHDENTKTCFDKFDLTSWRLFFESQTVFLNISCGEAFDSVMFDAPNFITYFQDKSRDPSKQSSDQDQNIIYETYQKCEKIFNKIEKNTLFKQILEEKEIERNKKLQIRLVFRTFKKYNKIKVSDRLSKLNLIILDKEAILQRTQGIFDHKVQFMSDERIE